MSSNTVRKGGIFFYGTGQTPEAEWQKGSNLALLEKYTCHRRQRQKSHGIRGVGSKVELPKISEEDLRNPVLAKLAQLVTGAKMIAQGAVNMWEQAAGNQIMDRVKEGWVHTQNYTNADEVYVYGMSRGAFEAQLITALMNDHGRPLDSEDAERVIQGVSSGYPPLTRPGANVKALFALEPVATHGMDGITSIFPSGWCPEHPRPYCGFTFHGIPSNVSRVYVVLTAKEDRFFMRPNIYGAVKLEIQILQQFWFQGVHGDTMGPSLIALTILAYLCVQMKDCGIAFGKDSEGNRLENQLRTLYQGSVLEVYSRPYPAVAAVLIPRPRDLHSRHTKLHWSYNAKVPLGVTYSRHACIDTDRPRLWVAGERWEKDLRAFWGI